MADDVTKKDLQSLEKDLNKRMHELEKKVAEVDFRLQDKISRNLLELIDITTMLRKSIEDHTKRIAAIEQHNRS